MRKVMYGRQLVYTCVSEQVNSKSIYAFLLSEAYNSTSFLDTLCIMLWLIKGEEGASYL